MTFLDVFLSTYRSAKEQVKESVATAYHSIDSLFVGSYAPQLAFVGNHQNLFQQQPQEEEQKDYRLLFAKKHGTHKCTKGTKAVINGSKIDLDYIKKRAKENGYSLTKMIAKEYNMNMEQARKALKLGQRK